MLKTRFKKINNASNIALLLYLRIFNSQLIINVCISLEKMDAFTSIENNRHFNKVNYDFRHP